MRAAVDIVERDNRGNVALVLIEDGVIAAEHYSTVANPVDRDTMFPAASMSKWITAWAVMKLVEDRKLDLDRPVNDYLSRWHLPESGFDNRKVTARRLLSHTAGLKDGLGFGDYLPTEVVPTIEQSLASPRASSGEVVAIAPGIEPGTQWRYSGGGYLLLELLVEEVSGETFAPYVERSILQPLGMTRSGYDYLGGLENRAQSFDDDGRPAATYRYASNGATAFHASAADMVRFVLAQLPIVAEKPLTQATIDAMRDPHASSQGVEIWGLGTMLYAPSKGGAFVFGHDGTNDPGISAAARVNPETNDGILVLVTGSRTLASTIGGHWVHWQTGLPDFLSIPGELQRVLPVLLGGIFFILLAAGLAAWRRRRDRRTSNSSELSRRMKA
jgi:CubicO group peptidase (beta-lactamase class C family)